MAELENTATAETAAIVPEEEVRICLFSIGGDAYALPVGILAEIIIPQKVCSPYSDRALRRWAARVRDWQDEGRSVHLYFDNTDLGHAVSNAGALARLVAAGAGPGSDHA